MADNEFLAAAVDAQSLKRRSRTAMQWGLMTISRCRLGFLLMSQHGKVDLHENVRCVLRRRVETICQKDICRNLPDSVT